MDRILLGFQVDRSVEKFSISLLDFLLSLDRFGLLRLGGSFLLFVLFLLVLGFRFGRFRGLLCGFGLLFNINDFFIDLCGINILVAVCFIAFPQCNEHDQPDDR